MGQLANITQADDARRGLLANPDNLADLNATEREIAGAMTSQAIKDMQPREYVATMARLLRYIAIDTGYNVPKDVQMWQYIQTRISEIIRRYYGDMTIKDVKLAFELLVTGELNAYLPKDSAGNPDAKHYQQFNAMYFSKVLKAYAAKRNDVIAKCYKAAEQRPALPSNDDEYYDNLIREKNIKVYERYRDTGVLDFYVGGVLFVWEWLQHAGMVSGYEITPEERRNAARRITQNVKQHLMSPDAAHYILMHQDESKEIDDIAFVMAKKREIKNAFDRIIKENINIKKYI